MVVSMLLPSSIAVTEQPFPDTPPWSLAISKTAGAHQFPSGVSKLDRSLRTATSVNTNAWLYWKCVAFFGCSARTPASLEQAHRWSVRAIESPHFDSHQPATH
jgi:hypothetical protein